VNGIGRRPNLPGREALDYRLGTRARFAAAMRDALGAQPALAGLTTREADDPAIALLDAWATTLDVLAFYQERLANEGFLRTATERASVLELARMVGHELAPGVAATTWLSFEVQAAPGGLDAFPIPAGTGAQSVPGPGELPQVFETVDAIEARPAWNAIPVQCEAAFVPAIGATALNLAGTDLALQPGDPLLVLVPGAGGGWFDLRRVRAARVVQAVMAAPTDPVPLVAAHTRVELDAPLASRGALTFALKLPAPQVHVLRQRAALFGHNALPWEALPAALRVGEFNPDAEAEMSLIAAVKAAAGATTATPVQRVLPGAYRNRRTSWADAAFPAGTVTADLDQVYPRLVAGGYAVFEDGATLAPRRIGSVAETSRADFGLSGRVTRLGLLGGDIAGVVPRTTAVLAQSEQLAFGPAPLAEEVAATDILDLARAVPALAPGRRIAVTGQDMAGNAVAEIATIRLVGSGPAGPRLTLEKRLTQRYRRTTLRVLANVAKATHGQSRAEVLGSGDQRLRFQTFALRHLPLTHVPWTGEGGARSTLAVWVGGVRWAEVPTLHGQGPEARVYVARQAEDGTVTLTFGDGHTGARLPTGRDNVVATLRVGIGRAALLPAGRITLPLQRPLGLMGVTNPVPAEGADDPEPLALARLNAPAGMRTLGRIVSLRDHEDFAATFAGIGRARADLLWQEERRFVHVTVTGPDGALVPPGAEVLATLAQAIGAQRHAALPMEVAGYAPRRFALTARLVVAADRVPAQVAAAARAAVLAAHGPAAAELARPVAAAAVIALLQGVPGVEAVLLDAFHPADAATPTRERAIPAWPARRSGAAILPADLVTVDPARLLLTPIRATEALA
jgi:hypothetical protein